MHIVGVIICLFGIASGIFVVIYGLYEHVSGKVKEIGLWQSIEYAMLLFSVTVILAILYELVPVNWVTVIASILLLVPSIITRIKDLVR